ncbi:MAG: hypothetical protein A2Z13_07030 [Deltaproteobacteria bacterium RBG_16_64_85]|nr:MAG: hypothetical protein A2Z13_07030 [Deltaproteobacteria bacterium RBG_16_64_85]
MFITVKSGKSLGDVRQKFEDAAAERKFGVQAIHNVTATLRSKGLAFGRTLYIYEVCNPVAAKKVLDTNIKIATALPCRVTIYVDGKDVVLETLKPTILLKMFNEPELEATAKEVEAAIEEIMREAAK